MKLLLDECTPQRLKADFTGHEVLTVNDVGLRGVKKGALLKAAAGDFDALITVDRKMPRQPSVSGLDLALIILVARPCRYPQLKQQFLRSLLEAIKPGEVIVIGFEILSFHPDISHLWRHQAQFGHEPGD